MECLGAQRFHFSGQSVHVKSQNFLMINAERINSQLSLLHEKAIVSVDCRGGQGGGQFNDQHREDEHSTHHFSCTIHKI